MKKIYFVLMIFILIAIPSYASKPTAPNAPIIPIAPVVPIVPIIGTPPNLEYIDIPISNDPLNQSVEENKLLVDYWKIQRPYVELKLREEINKKLLNYKTGDKHITELSINSVNLQSPPQYIDNRLYLPSGKWSVDIKGIYTVKIWDGFSKPKKDIHIPFALKVPDLQFSLRRTKTFSRGNLKISSVVLDDFKSNINLRTGDFILDIVIIILKNMTFNQFRLNSAEKIAGEVVMPQTREEISTVSNMINRFSNTLLASTPIKSIGLLPPVPSYTIFNPLGCSPFFFEVPNPFDCPKTGFIHEGIDYISRLSDNQKVYAADAGRAFTIRTDGKMGYGNTVIIVNDLYTTVYSHLKNISISSNSIVKRGDRIGTIGGTGLPEFIPEHLHFELRDSKDYKKILNPSNLFFKNRPVVTNSIIVTTYSLKPTNLESGKDYEFSQEILGKPSSKIYHFLQRPDGTYEYNNNDFGYATDAAGKNTVISKFTLTLPTDTNNGIYKTWVVVDKIKSNVVEIKVTSANINTNVKVKTEKVNSWLKNFTSIWKW